MVITAQDTKIKQGYKQTEVGVIPKDWEVKTIGEAFDIYNHLRYPISQDARKKMAGIYPYYGPTKVQDYINEYRVEGEYALIGEDGDHFLKWQDSPMTLLVNGKFNVNNHAHLVKGTRNLTSWFYYYFQNKDLTPYLTRQGAGRYKLTKNTLITIPCPLPPLSEQRAIATALSDVDALITSLDKLIAKKRDIKQATMQQLLTGRTRLPGFGGEWEVRKFGEIFQFLNTANNSRSDFSENGEIKYIHYGDIHTKWRSFLDCSSNELPLIQRDRVGNVPFLEDGDLVMADASEDYDGIGISVEVKNATDKKIVAGLHTFLLRGDKEVLADGFKGYLQYIPAVKDSLKKAATGISVYGISKNNVKNISICLPDVMEQQAIATILSDMDAEIAALEQKRDKTRALKQGMMQELLTGKTRLL